MSKVPVVPLTMILMTENSQIKYIQKKRISGKNSTDKKSNMSSSCTDLCTLPLSKAQVLHKYPLISFIFAIFNELCCFTAINILVPGPHG